MKFLHTGLVLLVIIIISFSGITLAQTAPVLEMEADSAVLLDFDSGQVLFSKDAQSPHVPASLVKIMTMYVALDQVSAGRIALTDQITVSERAWRMTGSRMFLEPNEVVTVEQLLAGVAVVSGNDASVALAEGLAGSEGAFVQWMNNKADDLDLDLEFVDVHGLSPENTITAEGIATLVRSYLQDHPDAIEYHQQRTFSYQPRSSSNPIEQMNRNGLLRSYDGADGLKTGHLQVAGYNLVGTALQNNRRMIAVVLGSTGERRREQEVATLLDYGYRNFDLVDISKLLEDQTTRVYKGRQSQVGLMINEPIITVPKGIEAGVSVGLQTKELEAPIEQGAEIGILSIYVDDDLAKQVPLFAAEEVARGNWFKVLWDSLTRFFQDLFRSR